MPAQIAWPKAIDIKAGVPQFPPSAGEDKPDLRTKDSVGSRPSFVAELREIAPVFSG